MDIRIFWLKFGELRVSISKAAPSVS